MVDADAGRHASGGRCGPKGLQPAHGVRDIPDVVQALGADLGKSSPIGGSVIPVSEAQALETDRAIATFKDTRRPLTKALVLV